jgi:hypothetical protein
MTNTQRRQYAALALVCLAWVGLSGCGYALAGRGSFLPDTIKTIGVPNLVNNTPVFDIELMLTARMRQEFIGRGKYKVIPEATGADAVLTGEITSISASPTRFNDQQQAVSYAVVVVLKMEFRDEQQGKVIWENPALVFREEYDVILLSGTTGDPNLFFGSSNNALDRISTDFARTVVSSILEAF